MDKWKRRLKADPTSQLREKDNLPLCYWLLRRQEAEGHWTKGRRPLEGRLRTMVRRAEPLDHLGCSEGHQKAIWIIEPSCVKMYKEAYCLFNNISIFEDTLRLKEMLK